MNPDKTPSPEPIAQPAVELFDQRAHTWEEVRDDILELEKLCFPNGSFEESYLKAHFENPETIVVLLKKAGKIIGFSYAIADEDVEGAAYIDTTEIHPSEQGKGHVVPMMAVLEAQARTRGYKFLTRNAAIENGYADKVQKTYRDRIVEMHDNDSEYGPQRYFKITL